MKKWISDKGWTLIQLLSLLLCVVLFLCTLPPPQDVEAESQRPTLFQKHRSELAAEIYVARIAVEKAEYTHGDIPGEIAQISYKLAEDFLNYDPDKVEKQ